eukprot:1836965-Rhodomonas_salina.1
MHSRVICNRCALTTPRAAFLPRPSSHHPIAFPDTHNTAAHTTPQLTRCAWCFFLRGLVQDDDADEEEDEEEGGAADDDDDDDDDEEEEEEDDDDDEVALIPCVRCRVRHVGS